MSSQGADLLGSIQAKHDEVASAEAKVQALSAQRRELIREARASGVTVQAIADALGVSRTRVYKLADQKYR